MDNEVIRREMYGIVAVMIAAVVTAIVTGVVVAVFGTSAYYTFIGVMLFIVVGLLVAGAIAELEEQTNTGFY